MLTEYHVPFPVANVKYTASKADSGRVSSTKQKRLSVDNHVVITTSIHVNRMAWCLEGNIGTCMGLWSAVAGESVEKRFHPWDFFIWPHCSLSLQTKARKGPGISYFLEHLVVQCNGISTRNINQTVIASMLIIIHAHVIIPPSCLPKLHSLPFMKKLINDITFINTVILFQYIIPTRCTSHRVYLTL